MWLEMEQLHTVQATLAVSENEEDPSYIEIVDVLKKKVVFEKK